MAIDPYAPCPCGSGKKLKFCCADLAGDVEKVSKLVASDQPHAALKHVEQLLAKQPDRASLLDLQAMLQLSLGDYDAAEKSISRFLAVAPESAIAHAERAMLAASRGPLGFRGRLLPGPPPRLRVRDEGAQPHARVAPPRGQAARRLGTGLRPGAAVAAAAACGPARTRLSRWPRSCGGCRGSHGSTTSSHTPFIELRVGPDGCRG